MNRTLNTCYHEAGHAVVGRHLGLVCGDVEISEPDNPEHLGWAHVEGPHHNWERGDGPKRPLAEAFCIALYAGAEAERAFLGSTDVGDSEDCDRAQACMTWVGVRGAQFVGDDAYDRYEARLRRQAATLVSRLRARIERVAGELRRKGKLTAAEVDALMA